MRLGTLDMPNQVPASVNDCDDVTRITTNLINYPIWIHQDFAEMIQAKLRHHRSSANTACEPSRCVIDSLARSQCILRGVPRDEIHDLLEISYCRVSPY